MSEADSLKKLKKEKKGQRGGGGSCLVAHGYENSLANRPETALPHLDISLANLQNHTFWSLKPPFNAYKRNYI